MKDFFEFTLKSSVLIILSFISTTAFGTVILEKMTKESDGLYHIKTVGNLYWFAKNKNGDAVLDNDIVVNEGVLDATGALNAGSFEAWTPIGSNTSPFSGSLNGRGHSIKGLYFKNTSNVTDAKYLGLFGAVQDATIDSVTIEDCYIHGYSVVGGICGYASGNVTISNCTNKSTICGMASSIGGICAWSNGTVEISNCYNTGWIKGARNASGCQYIGGICGYSQSEQTSIKYCSNLGSVSGESSCRYIGGICGHFNDGSIYGCSNLGSVSGGANYVGAICGDAYRSTASVKGCYVVYKGLDICGDVYLADVQSNYIIGADGSIISGTSLPDGAMASGELAYILRQNDESWGQRLGVDATPVIGGPAVYKVTATVNDETMGSVIGAGYCNSGSVLKAVPNDGYRFVGWNTGETSEKLVLDITADADFVATFAPAVTNNAKLYSGTSDYEDVYWNPTKLFVPTGNSILLSEDSTIKGSNVVYESEEGDYRCHKFMLTDGANFYSPVDFLADTLTYSRTMSTGYSTFILPFKVPIDFINGDVYRFSDFDGSHFRFKRVVDETIDANVPYLVRINEGDEGNLVTECYGVKCVAGTPQTINIDEAGHFGLYETQKRTTDTHRTYYGFSAGSLLKVNKTFTVKPFRTGFFIDTPTSNKLSSIGLLFDDRLGVEYVSADAENNLVKVFDVYGRLVYAGLNYEGCLHSLPNGVYVVNGKKVVVINGCFSF